MTISLAPGAVSFIAKNGQYVGSSTKDKSLEAVSKTAGYQEVFLLSTVGSKFGLQAGSGKYLTAEGGGGKKLFANCPHLAAWENFEITPQPDNRVVFRVNNGKCWSAIDGGGRELLADREADTSPASRECFRLVRWISLSAANGKLVRLDETGQGRLVADADSLNESAVFQLIYFGGDKVAIRARSGKYLCADFGGGSKVVVNRDNADGWETFDLVKQPNGQFVIRASNGWLLDLRAGEVTADGEPNRPGKPFNITMLGGEVWPLLPNALTVQDLYNLNDAVVKKEVVRIFANQLKASPSVSKLFFGSEPADTINWPYAEFTDNVACALVASAVSRSASWGFNKTVDQTKADAYWQTQLASADAVKAGQWLYELFFPEHCHNEKQTFQQYLDDDPAKWATKFAAHLTSNNYINVEMLKLFAGKANWLQSLNLSLYKLHRLNPLSVPPVVEIWKNAFPDKGIAANWETYNYFPIVNFQGDQFVAQANQAINVKISKSRRIPGKPPLMPDMTSTDIYYGKAVEDFLKGKPARFGITTGRGPDNHQHSYD